MIKFPFNRSALILEALVGVSFSLLIVWLTIGAALARSSWSAGAIAGVVLFGLIGLGALIAAFGPLVTLLKQTPAIGVNHLGILIGQSFGQTKALKWENVDTIDVVVRTTRFPHFLSTSAYFEVTDKRRTSAVQIALSMTHGRTHDSFERIVAVLKAHPQASPKLSQSALEYSKSTVSKFQLYCEAIVNAAPAIIFIIGMLIIWYLMRADTGRGLF